MTEALTPRFPLYVTGTTDAPKAIVVVQEAFGVTTHIQDVADGFADAGFFAVAPHLYHREGHVVLGYDDFTQVMPYMQRLTAEGISNDLDATFAFLASLGYQPENIGIVGYCMGGVVSFYAATTGKVGAAVSYYGGPFSNGRFGFKPVLEMVPELKAPWLGHYGGDDHGIPVEEVELLRTALATAPVKNELEFYPEAKHGFNCNDRPAVYDSVIAAEALATTLRFFNDELVARSASEATQR